MSIIKNKIYNIFKWNTEELVKALIGIIIFSIAINIFIVPNSLYNGGVLGISQLIRSFLSTMFHIEFTFDISGLIYFIINIPLFILAYKKVSKPFFWRTILCVVIQTIFLSIIPVPEQPIVDSMLTSVLIGGILAGIGCGMSLSAGSSGGGTEIVGIIISMKNRNLSVGKLDLVINIIIYIICGVLYGLETMIYSIIYSVFLTLMLDNTHEQNICSTAIVFTKNKPDKILDFVKNTIDRDATYWEATGGYNHSKTYITYIVLSKYELQRLERQLKDLDPNAFLVKANGVEINGNFQKVFTD